MGIKIRKHGTVVASFATPQEIVIDHANDDIRVGDGTDLMGPLSNVGGVLCFPVDIKQVAAGTLATSTKQSDGSQKTQIVDAAANVGEFDDVGGEKALKVSVIASVGGGGGGTAATDSAAFTVGATQFTPIGGHLDDTASDALAEGEMGAVRMTSARALHVAVQNSVAVTGTFWQATQPISAASLPLPTDAATETTLAALLVDTGQIEALLTTIDADTGGILTAVQLIDDAIATLAAAIPAKGVLMAGTDAGTARAVKVDANGELQVDVLSSALPSGASTLAEQQTQSTHLSAIKTAVELIDNAISGSEMQVDIVGSLPAGTNNIGDVDVLSLPGVAGDVAHDAADSGNPVKIGAQAYNTSITNVANGDRVNLIADKQGALVVVPVKPREFIRTQVTTITNTTETTIVTAGGAGVFNDIVAMIITNNSDVQSTCTIKDSTAGTTRMTFLVPARGGVVFQPCTPLAQQAAANNNWTATMGTTATSTNISVMYAINT